MIEVQRIWRVGAGSDAVEVSLQTGSPGRPMVGLRLPGGGADGEQTFDVELVQAMAQAMLEACEISTALTVPADGRRPEVRVP
jgi:hypothetical protein